MPCREAAPTLEQAWISKQNAGLAVIGVHADVRHRPMDGLATAVDGFGLTFPVGLDTRERSFQKYGVVYFPHVVLVGIDGLIAWHGDPMSDDFQIQLEMALAEVPSPVEFTATEWAPEVNPLAVAAETGDYGTAIEGLVELLGTAETAADVREDATAVLDLIGEVADSLLERIDDLEQRKLYVECDAVLGSAVWLRSLDRCRAHLDQLLAARDEADHTAGTAAGQRFHQGLDHLRAGDLRRAKTEFAAVARDAAATGYGALAARYASELP